VQFKRAIVRLPAENFSDGIASSIGGGNPQFAEALVQHHQYRLALEDCGLRLITLPADPCYPDSTFIEDTAVVTPRVAIITRPGAASRLGETTDTLGVLRELFPEIRQIHSPGTVDGGDVCEVDGMFIVGHSGRTNAEGITQLRGYLAEFGHALTVIDIRDCASLLHLKSGMSYVGDGVFVVDRELRAAEALSSFDLLEVRPDEAYAANCVRVNECVLIPAGFPSVSDQLRGWGFKLVPLTMSEFRKMDGGLSCLSLRF
jgi:dimethylargininase